MGGAPPEGWSSVVAALRASPELGGDDWDAFALCVEVSDHRLATTAYRYLGAGPPVSTEPADEIDDQVWDLWDAARAAGTAWDVALVRLHRETDRVAVDLLSATDAEAWRIAPDTLATLPEALRPGPGDLA